MTNEIDLKMRYPKSRLEDVTDAFMRGYQSCLETRPNPTWVKWLESLRHDEVKTLGDAVEQLMYEAIEHGGDMGPNGNVWNGVDEGDVLTVGFINEWVERIADVTGLGHCQYVGEDADNMAGVVFRCSKCGNAEWPRPRNYCPSCGRMILR